MSTVGPYSETETLPRGRRLLLVPVAGAFLVGPYGLMLQGGPDGAVPWLLTAIAIGVGAAFAGVGIGYPRRRVTADGDARDIEIARTAPLPHVGTVRHHFPFDAVAGTRIEELGPAGTSVRAFRPVIDLVDGRAILLRTQPTFDHAQDVIDHLAFLGLPGNSRAAQREAQLDFSPPPTWL